MIHERLVADRWRGSKRTKKVHLIEWLCNPQVLKAMFAVARLADSLVRLAKELVRIFAQH